MAYLHYFNDLHCSTCSHSARFELLWAGAAQTKNPHPDVGRPNWISSNDSFSGLFICGTCRAPSMIRFLQKKGVRGEQSWERVLNRLNPVTSEKGQGGHVMIPNASQGYGINLGRCFEITDSFPSTVITSPKDLPANVERFWVDELSNIMGAPISKVAMCRKILELMCKDKGAKGGNLKLKIDDLVANGALTKDLGEWAHAIRELGNEAVHDDEPIGADVANEVYEFTRVIAEILYSYPARIARLRRGDTV